MLEIVKISIGVGKSFSATIGAVSAMLIAAKLAIPREVEANRVGNILGWIINEAVKVKTLPKRAAQTRAGRVQVGSLGLTMNTMARPVKT